MVYCELLNHVAVTSLSHASFRLLINMAAAFNGKNNGALGITAAQAAEVGFTNRRTLYRSFKDLEGRGLIAQTYPASRVPPRPNMWALTWFPLNDTKFTDATRLPSNDYLNWSQERVTEKKFDVPFSHSRGGKSATHGTSPKPYKCSIATQGNNNQQLTELP